LILAVVFAVGEMGVAGSFFLAPFAIGAAVAAILAFADIGLGFQWTAFLGISVASFLALRPLARRLDSDHPVVGIGSNRQVGQRAKVVERIGGEHQPGFVLLGQERWRAETMSGQAIEAGATVFVVEVRGTRVVVAPADAGPQPEVEAPPLAP